MPKPNLADHLVQELTACRAEGGEHYPIRLDRLTARLTPIPEPAAALKAVGSKAFTDRAVAVAKGRMDAPVALREDLSLLMTSPLTLEMTLRAKGEKESPPWTPAKLAGALPKSSVRTAFLSSLNQQIEANELPAFAVRVGKEKSVKLHHRDQTIPPAPEVQDAERLLDLLRRREQLGTTLTELQSTAGLKPTAFKKAVKQPAFTDAVTQVKVSPDVYVVPNGDEFRRFVMGTLLACLLRGCKRANAQAFSVKELVALVSGKVQQQSVAGLLSRPDLANDLPTGVGYVLVGAGKGSQNVFFLLEDVRTAKPPARTGTAPALTALPVDFVTVFDAAFARLDRERGSHNFVSLVDLRAALSNISRETFDAELRELRRARRYVLSSDERYEGITSEQQTAAIREEGEFLLHVSRGRQ